MPSSLLLQPLLTADEMRRHEDHGLRTWGISSLVLQEHAALGALALLPEGAPLKVLAGPGNNGGDALALARLARLRGHAVDVWPLGEPSSWRGDAALQARLWEGLGGGYCEIPDPRAALEGFQGWVVDGLFGLGARLPLQGRARLWVEALGPDVPRGFRVLALDQPSGLDPSLGDLPGPCIQADRTACFGHRKICHGLRPAREACGAITVVPLPLPGCPEAGLALLEDPRLPGLPWDAHKRRAGHLAIRAGSLGMSGAAVLAAEGALRMGAGLVTLLVDPALRAEIAAQVPEALVCPWEGRVPEGVDALLVGPGGVTDVPDWPGPLVLDASALGLWEGPRWLERPGTVLTPHAGEWARLFGGEPPREPSSRLAAVRQASGPAIRVLKGAQTLVAGGNDPQVWVNPTGHSGLATGGSGDFLAGMVGALAARWGREDGRNGGVLRSHVAAAVWFHAAAADHLGAGPLRVRDLGPALSAVLRQRSGHA
ncbi:MAG TPA: NAD(P)H-hydrate dehydratase [Holophaga sp.]|nr:NAD(P)H-hydrate dehydratase [Holophaga sp.]